jgi:hypothetical protein
MSFIRCRSFFFILIFLFFVVFFLIFFSFSFHSFTSNLSTELQASPSHSHAAPSAPLHSNSELVYRLVSTEFSSSFPSSFPYYTLPLSGLIPEFDPLYNTDNALNYLELTIFAVRYRPEEGIFTFQSLLHCTSNSPACPSQSDQNNTSKSDSNYNSLYQPLLLSEWRFLSSGLTCEFVWSSSHSVEQRVQSFTRQLHNELVCIWPLKPAQPPKRLTVKLRFRGLQRQSASLIENSSPGNFHSLGVNSGPAQKKKRKGKNKANNQISEASIEENQIQVDYSAIRRSLLEQLELREGSIIASPHGILDFPVLFSLDLPIKAEIKEKINIALCIPTLHSDSQLPHFINYLFHHSYIGVEKFVIFDRWGHYKQLVEPLVKADLVEYYLFTPLTRWQWQPSYDRFLLAESCRFMYGRHAKWISIHDIDEYLVIQPPVHAIKQSETAENSLSTSRYFPSTCLKYDPKVFNPQLYPNLASLALHPEYQIFWSLDRHQAALNFENSFLHHSFPLNSLEYYDENSEPLSSSNPFITPSTLSLSTSSIITAYRRYFPSPCRSLLTDSIISLQLLPSPQSPYELRQISIEAVPFIHRSPQFLYSLYHQQKQRNGDKQTKKKKKEKEQKKSQITIGSNNYYMPLIKSFTWSERLGAPRSLLLADSRCGVGYHFHFGCWFDDDRPSWPLKQLKQMPRVPVDQMIFLRFLNSQTHGNRFGAPELDDFYHDLAREKYEKDEKSFQYLSSIDQSKYLPANEQTNSFTDKWDDWGPGLGEVTIGIQFHSAMQKWIEQEKNKL